MQIKFFIIFIPSIDLILIKSGLNLVHRKSKIKVCFSQINFSLFLNSHKRRPKISNFQGQNNWYVDRIRNISWFRALEKSNFHHFHAIFLFCIQRNEQMLNCRLKPQNYTKRSRLSPKSLWKFLFQKIFTFNQMTFFKIESQNPWDFRFSKKYFARA